jgi:hypothetical protein
MQRRSDDMTLFRCIVFLQFTTTVALGQLAQEPNPAGLPKEPEALARSLYQQVVARHPLGVPYGADMKVFAPYLSKALLHRFDLNDACFADWHRQNPAPNLKPPVGSIEDGLFSGANEEAEPQAFHIERTESEKDGSFRVRVRLTRGAAPENPLIWRVAAVVVPESGRFVVDDVIYLKDEARDVDSRLSEYLSAGCDGARWVGYGGRRNDVKQQR